MHFLSCADHRFGLSFSLCSSLFGLEFGLAITLLLLFDFLLAKHVGFESLFLLGFDALFHLLLPFLLSAATGKLLFTLFLALQRAVDDIFSLQFHSVGQLDVQEGCLVHVCLNKDVLIAVLSSPHRRQSSLSSRARGHLLLLCHVLRGLLGAWGYCLLRGLSG